MENNFITITYYFKTPIIIIFNYLYNRNFCTTNTNLGENHFTTVSVYFP